VAAALQQKILNRRLRTVQKDTGDRVYEWKYPRLNNSCELMVMLCLNNEFT
jgi:hypothetical protein